MLVHSAIPALRARSPSVVAAPYNTKIVSAIIQAVVIDVIDLFVGCEFSPEYTVNNFAVQRDAARHIIARLVSGTARICDRAPT